MHTVRIAETAWMGFLDATPGGRAQKYEISGCEHAGAPAPLAEPVKPCSQPVGQQRQITLTCELLGPILALTRVSVSCVGRFTAGFKPL